MNQIRQLRESAFNLESAIGEVNGDRFSLIIFLLGGICFSLLINNSWNASPDSALYLSLGQSLAAGNGYVFNGEPHTYVPPGFPFLLYVSTKLFGTMFWGYRFTMALMGFLTVIVGYIFIRDYAGKNTAQLILPALMANYVIISNSALVLADVPFALFSLISFIAILRAGRSEPNFISVVVSGILLSIPSLIRVNGLGFAPAIAFFLFFAWRSTPLLTRLFWILLVVALSYLPMLLWIWWKSGFPQSVSEGTYFGAVTGRKWHDQLRVIWQAFMAYFSEITLAMTGLTIKTGIIEFLLPLVVGLGAAVKLLNGDRFLVPLVAIQFCGLLLSSAGERYLIFMVPALYLFFIEGVAQITHSLQKVDSSNFRLRKILRICFGIFVLFNLGHSVMVLYAARNPIQIGGAETERSVPYFKAANWLKANDPGGIVLSTHSRVIHFLSGNRTVALVRSGVPEHETWIDNSDQITGIILKERPTYLFRDNKNGSMYDSAGNAFHQLGCSLEPIPEASQQPRYELYKIKY